MGILTCSQLHERQIVCNRTTKLPVQRKKFSLCSRKHSNFKVYIYIKYGSEFKAIKWEHCTGIYVLNVKYTFILVSRQVSAGNLQHVEQQNFALIFFVCQVKVLCLNHASSLHVSIEYSIYIPLNTFQLNIRFMYF